MEGHSSTETKKRDRDNDSLDSLDSPGLKRLIGEFSRVDSFPTRDRSPVSDFWQIGSGNALHGAEDGDELASPEVVKLRKDILDILDEPETVPETQELDSVIRSFEEEILQSSAPSKTHQVTSFLGAPQPDLGYLLGASDDELGLPPSSTTVAGEQTQTQTEPVNEGPVDAFDSMAGFQDELPGYDPFDLDVVDGLIEGNGVGFFDDMDGLDFSDLAWRPESLPAL